MRAGTKEWVWLIINAIAEIALMWSIWDLPIKQYILAVCLLGLANLASTEAHRLKIKRTIAALPFRGPVG